jgi:hypothetical protein
MKKMNSIYGNWKLRKFENLGSTQISYVGPSKFLCIKLFETLIGLKPLHLSPLQNAINSK